MIFNFHFKKAPSELFARLLYWRISQDVFRVAMALTLKRVCLTAKGYWHSFGLLSVLRNKRSSGLDALIFFNDLFEVSRLFELKRLRVLG